jgi:hypothetical protein
MSLFLSGIYDPHKQFVAVNTVEPIDFKTLKKKDICRWQMSLQ